MTQLPHDGAGAGFLVREQHHLRAVRTGGHHAADHASGGDHRHVYFHSGPATLVDGHVIEPHGRISGDNVCHHCFVVTLGIQAEELFQPFGFSRTFARVAQLGLHLPDLLPQLLILGGSPTKFTDIAKESSDPVSETRGATLNRRGDGLRQRPNLSLLGGLVAGIVSHQSKIQRQQSEQPPRGALSNLSLSANCSHWFVCREPLTGNRKYGEFLFQARKHEPFPVHGLLLMFRWSSCYPT